VIANAIEQARLEIALAIARLGVGVMSKVYPSRSLGSCASARASRTAAVRRDS
jgi:hypothetical protein